MKRMRAILCGVLAALMLAGCGGVERVACQSERPSPDMNLTQYTVVEAAYPVFPKEPVYGDYIDDNGEGDWDAYFAAQEAYREELRQMGKGENVDDGAVLDFAGRTAAEIFAGQENTVYSPISLYVALGMLTELTECDDGARMVWSVPKFDVKSSVELKDVLRALGVADAFDADKADFAPLTDGDAVVSSVMQAARVKIDEEGVEAAAYTEISVNDSAPMEPPSVVEMNLNRPFLFVIFSDDDVPLFIGTVHSVEG